MTPNPTSQVRCTLGNATFTNKSTKKWNWKAGPSKRAKGDKPLSNIRDILATKAGALHGGNGIKIGSTIHKSMEAAYAALHGNQSLEGVNFRIVMKGEVAA